MNKILYITLGSLLLLGTTLLLLKETQKMSLQAGAIPAKVVESYNQWCVKYGIKKGSKEEETKSLKVFYTNY